MKALIVWMFFLVVLAACRICAWRLKKKGTLLWEMKDYRDREVYDFPLEIIKPEKA